MAEYLIIVESPTKAKTISGFLTADYEVISSMGHLVDLAPHKLSVDIENGFQPHYYIIKGKEKIINQLKRKVKDKRVIYIATDPDREGEAIGWHIKERLSKEDKNKDFYRIIFHEITPEAIKEALKTPTTLNIHLVNAQLARRVLDRIVGYNLSPLLWKKVLRGLSAGRVQSVALRFIVKREKEIQDFVPQTTFGVEASFKKGEVIFKARLQRYADKKAVFNTEQEAQLVLEELRRQNFFVKDILKKEVKRIPPPPLTTSLLQQEAFNRLGFSSQKAMLIAQRLYEGVLMDKKMVGLITYMRTDSFRVSPKAKKEADAFIRENFSKDYLLEKEYSYREKRGAQLAHEAIRPTNVSYKPQDLKKFLSSEEVTLYELIWRRFLASRMKEAVFENTRVTIESASAQFIAEGKRLIFDGFLKVLQRGEENIILPTLHKDEVIELVDLGITPHTTKPPSRFNDASLVKLMEEKGIGRPSTYAPTIQTLITRNYIRRQKNFFVPTELGIKVNGILNKYFPEITDEKFTADMEEKLDQIEEGKEEWRKILEDFYPSFRKQIEEANLALKKEIEFSSKKCPRCGRSLLIKWSRKGKFLSCEGFPQCRYAESITTEINCPECKDGKLIERRNKRGQTFYGCSNFPNCSYTCRNLPNTEKG